MGTPGNKGRERLTKRERQALKDEGGVIDRGNTAAAGTRLAFRKSSCGVNTGPRRRKFDTRRPAKTNSSIVHAVLFVVLVVIVIPWALGY